MGEVLRMYNKDTDYCGNRQAAMGLIAKLRKFWREKGYDPMFELVQGYDDHGHDLFSIRSDINLSGPYRMNRVKPREFDEYY